MTTTKQQVYFWNNQPEYHPKSRLLKYSKSSKISQEVLEILRQSRRIHSKLPPIIYTQREQDEDEEETVVDYDLFGQLCHLSSRNKKTFWRPTSFYIPDWIFQQLKIDHDFVFYCLFPIYINIPRRTLSDRGQGKEEIYLPSTIPSTQYDLIQLQERFHAMLSNEEALEIGLCPIRRRLYDDLFDELIRLVTLQCSERGLLLARMKNEYVRWMNTYEEVYSSGMAYGLRKCLYTAEETEEKLKQIEELEHECRQVRDQIEYESTRFETFSRLINNRQEDEERQTFEKRLLKKNVEILRSTNEILRRDLHTTLNQILTSTIFLGEPINYENETN